MLNLNPFWKTCSTNPCPFSPRHRDASPRPKPSCQDHCTRKFTKCQLTIKVNLNDIWNYLGRKVMGFQKMDDRFNLYGYLKPWVVYHYMLILFVKSFVVRFLVSPCQNGGVNHFNWIFYETNMDKRCPWRLPKHSVGLVTSVFPYKTRYINWKVHGTVPMYWFIWALYQPLPFWVCAMCFDYKVWVLMCSPRLPNTLWRGVWTPKTYPKKPTSRGYDWKNVKETALSPLFCQKTCRLNDYFPSFSGKLRQQRVTRS